ncbi:DNL-type zinc finger protein isoform X2 [Tympanuchus pallidicinctus]|uniref:DNL-type zinc finger protein isoform X2 n=1 Tax=Tympanuchus pallidicinctus TaxID=109042 RepID=UPI002287274E|nr:DNL-type zinc finger protein isoform X2 [Tympanuchus pallidicinctus]
MAAEQKRQLGPPEDMALTTGEAYLSGRREKACWSCGVMGTSDAQAWSSRAGWGDCCGEPLEAGWLQTGIQSAGLLRASSSLPVGWVPFQPAGDHGWDRSSTRLRRGLRYKLGGYTRGCAHSPAWSQLSDLSQEGGRGSAQHSGQQVSAPWQQLKYSHPSHGQYRQIKCLVSSITGLKILLLVGNVSVKCILIRKC